LITSLVAPLLLSFFFTVTAPTEIYTLSLHDALPISYLTLGLPGDFETTGGAAARFRELLAFGLPLDYYDHYVDRINAITAADVQRVARQYIDPDHFDIVVVGDKSQIEAGIKALNEGPIVYRDLWGQEVR